MKILLDNNVNYRFGKLLFGHQVAHVQDIGWEALSNGNLLSKAELEGFQILALPISKCNISKIWQGAGYLSSYWGV